MLSLEKGKSAALANRLFKCNALDEQQWENFCKLGSSLVTVSLQVRAIGDSIAVWVWYID
jgi:hypothetical protein